MKDKPSKFSYVIWLIGNWFADAWFFCRNIVRNSAPQFIHRIWDFIAYSCMGFVRSLRSLGSRLKFAKFETQHRLGYLPHLVRRAFNWVKSSGVRAKVARQESRDAAGRLALGARSGVDMLFDLILYVIKSPILFLRWLWKLFRILRYLSLKDACQEAWGGYREFVERSFEYSKLYFYRFLDARWWVRALVLIVVIGGAVTVALGPWALRSFNAYRSQQVFAEAKYLQQKERIVEAYAKSKTAAMLNLDDPTTIDLVIELGEELNHPETVWWAERNVVAANFSEESLVKVIEIACEAGFPETAQKYLYSLQRRYPQSRYITDSKLRLLMAMHMNLEAFQLAEYAAANGEDSEAMHVILVNNGINSIEPERQATIIKHLQKHLYRQDEVGLALQQRIIQASDHLTRPIVESIDYGRLLDVIQQQENAQPVDIAQAIGIAYANNAISRENALQALAFLFDLSKQSDREQALEVASHFEFYELLDTLETEQIENVAFHMKRLLYGPNPDIEAAQTIIAQARKNGLSKKDEYRWLAMLAAYTNHFNQYANNLRLALQFSKSPRDAQEIQRIVLAHGSHQHIMEFWNSAFRYFPDSAEIANSALTYTYHHGERKELESITSQISLETLKSDPSNQQFLIYLKALYHNDLDACRKHGEALIMKHPHDSVYYVVLAFAYKQSNEPQLAQALLESFDLGSNYEIMPPYIRLCLAACGYQEAAPLPGSLPQPREHQLLQENIEFSL